MKLGAARDQSRTAWSLVTIEVAGEDATFSYRLAVDLLEAERHRSSARSPGLCIRGSRSSPINPNPMADAPPPHTRRNAGEIAGLAV
jgi:hypothetical protein